MKRSWILSWIVSVLLLIGAAHADIDILGSDYTVFQTNENSYTLVMDNKDGARIRQTSDEIDSLLDVAPGINEVDVLAYKGDGKADGLVNNRKYLIENSYMENGKVPIIVMFNLDNDKSVSRALSVSSGSFDDAKQAVLSVLTGNSFGIASTPEVTDVTDLKIIDGIALEAEETKIKDIAGLDVVKRVELDQRVNILLSDSVPLINATQVWKQLVNGTNVTGANVSIAIIDTGVDYTHPDLGGCLGTSCKVVGGYDFVNTDADPIDDHGHGTHVAATAASNGTLQGVAPNSKIYAYKVLSASGSGTFSQVISGIDRATDPNNDGNFSDHVDIISMSLGGFGDENSSASVATDRAVDRGVVVVAAAGNSGTATNAIGTPGAARKAITIAASDKSDNIAYFSSRGPTPKNNLKPDVTAPGVNICAAEWDSAWSTRRCYDNQHVSISGTSMATPHVAGLAALIKQLHPDWAPETIKSAIITTAKDLGYTIWAQGTGRIQALKAVNASVATNPASLSFGEVLGSNVSVLFTVINLRSSAAAINISVTNVTDGTTTYRKGSVNASSITLNAYSNATLNLTIDTAGMTGNLYGFVNVSDGVDNYRVPFAFIKISKITVIAGHSRNIAPSLFALHNSDLSTTRSAYLYWDYSGKNYTFSVPSGNYTVYAIGDSLNTTLNYILVGNTTVQDSSSTIVLNTSDASVFTLKAEQVNGSSLELYKWFYGAGRRSPKFYSILKGYLGGYSFLGNRTIYISNTSFDPGLNFTLYYIGYPTRSKLSTESTYTWNGKTFTAASELYYVGWVFNNVSSGTQKTLNYSADDFTVHNATYNYPGYDPSENSNFQSYAAINFWISPVIWFDVSSWIYQAAPVKRAVYIRNTTTFGYEHYMHINYLRNSTLGGNWISEFGAAVGQTEEDTNVTFIWPIGSRSTASREMYFGTAYSPTYFENTNTTIKLADYALRGYSNETYAKKAGTVSWYSSTGASGSVILPRPNITIYKNGAFDFTSNDAGIWKKFSRSVASGRYVVNVTLPTAYPLYNITIITANFTVPSTDTNPPRLNSFNMSPRFDINTTERVTFNITDESLKNVSAFYSHDKVSWTEFNITNTSSLYNGTINITDSSASEIDIKITSFDNAGNGVTYQLNTASLLAVTPTISLSASTTSANRGTIINFYGLVSALKNLAQLRLEHLVDDVYHMYDRSGEGYGTYTYNLGRFNFFWTVPADQATSPVTIKARFNGTGVYKPTDKSVNITINIPQTGVPQHSNIVVFPSSPDANDNITINATWTISGSTIDRVLFESNHTGTLANYSTSNVSTKYNYTISGSGLAAGTAVAYRFIANNTAGVRNLTPVRTFTVSSISTNISSGQTLDVAGPNQNNTLWCDYAEAGVGDIIDATVYAEIDSANNTMSYSTNRYEYNYSNSQTGSKAWMCIANKTNFVSKRLQASFAIAETNAPTFTNITTSPDTKYRDSSITLNTTWSDDSGLSHVIFSSNFSGVWRNYTVVVGPSSPYVARYNVTNLTNGQVVGWKYFVNDTSGNMNSQMPVQSFTVQNRVPSVVLDSNDDNKGWGEGWNVKVNASDADNDSLSITLYARPSGGNWSLRNTSSGNGTVSINFSLNATYYNESEILVNASDGFSINGTAVNVTVDKDDISVTIVAGYNNSVLRYGAHTILVGIRVYDSDAAEYVNNTEARVIWTKDGLIPYDDERSCISSQGYCNITLDPDTTFTIGYQNFTGGTLPNSTFYKEINASPEVFFVNGSLFTSINGPFGVKNKTEIIYLNTTVTDDSSNSIASDEVNLEYKHTGENTWKSCTPVTDESDGIYSCGVNPENLSLGSHGVRYSAAKANYSSANTTVNHQFIIAKVTKFSGRSNFTANVPRRVEAATGDSNATFNMSLRQNVTEGEINVTFNSTNPAIINLSVVELGRYLTINVSDEISSNLDHAIVKVNYTDEEVNLSGVVEESLRLYRFNGTHWVAYDPPNGGVNTTENYVWGNVTAFSDFGIGGKKVNNASCTSNDECNSGNCAADYDGEGRWCAPANQCSHDYLTTYSTSSTFCSGSILYTCSSATWTNQVCANGCSAGACIASPSTSTGGSGAGAGGILIQTIELPATKVITAKGKSTITIPEIKRGEAALVNIDMPNETGIRRITIAARNTVKNISIVISKAEPSISQPTGKIYSYLQIDKANATDADISGVTIDFQVDKAWISANKIDNVLLNRFANNAWTELSTKQTEETSVHAFYRAESPGLSVFAITGSELPPVTPKQSATPTSLPSLSPLPIIVQYYGGWIAAFVILVAALGYLHYHHGHARKVPAGVKKIKKKRKKRFTLSDLRRK